MAKNSTKTTKMGEIAPQYDNNFEEFRPPQDPSQFEMIRKKVLFKECAMAGVSFHIKYDDEIWNELGVGAKVALVREKKALSHFS